MSALYYIVLAVILLNSTTVTPRDPVQAKTPTTTTAAPTQTRYDDQVTLKSGRVIQGVRVVRVTPFKLFLEVIPTVEPLEIPAKQVVSIAYGQPEPKQSTVMASPPEDSTESDQVLQAVKMAPDLAKRMSSPISEKEVLFNEQDLLNTLRSAGIMSGVPVTFGPHLEKIPPEERTFSLRLADGASFEEFFRDTIVPQVPWLKMEYRFDTVHFERE